MPGPFRVLFVCTGNVCRSAVAERLTTKALADQLGPAASAIEVHSAGVRALAGEGIDPRSATALTDLGGSADGFRARQLEPDHLGKADLILVATRRHRATTAKLLPTATTRTFTIREFARIAERLDVEAIPDGPPDQRLHDLMREVAALRGSVPRDGSGDDVEDPYGRSSDVHDRTAGVLDDALNPIVEVLAAAIEPLQVGAALDGREQRLLEARVLDAELASRQRRSMLRRRVRRGALIGAAVLVLLFAAALAYDGVVAKRELEATRPIADAAKTALLAGDVPAVRQQLTELQRHTGAARRAVAGQGWALGTLLPYVGDDLAAVRTAAETMDAIGQGILPRLVAVADATDLSKLRLSGGKIALAPLVDALPKLELADSGMRREARRLMAIDTASLLPPVRSGLGELSTQVDSLAGLTRDATATARVLPPLLGGEGTKRYFLAFQNVAEARGTGGLLGAYGILEATDGQLILRSLGTNSELQKAPEVPVDLGPSFRGLYGDAPRLWINANASPHFPYAAQIWLALWQRQFKEPLDGVIATDPVALGFLLGATGPVTGPGGREITSSNAARVTLRDVYERYPTVADSAARDQFLQDVAGAVAAKALSGKGDPRKVVVSLRRAMAERRLLIYSTDPEVQTELDRYQVSGIVPDDARPYLGVTVNSGVPSKLDYYLDRSITYTTTGCTSVARRSRVTVTLTNSAPAKGLPPYVALPPADRDVPALAGFPVGSNYLLLDIMPTQGTGLVKAMVDGRRADATAGRLRGHPVYGFNVALAPGQSSTVVVDLAEPRTAGEIEIERQPLVRPIEVDAQGESC